MTKLPFLPHSFTSGPALAVPTASASAPAPSISAAGCFTNTNAMTFTPRLTCLDRKLPPRRVDRGAAYPPVPRFRCCVASLSSTQSLAATDERLKNRGEHDDRAGREQLQSCIDIVELQHVGERAQHDRPCDRANHGPRAPEQAGAADDDGRNRG